VVGDKILCEIADLLKSNIRQGDIAGRFGGEEFIILLQSEDEESSFALVERLRKTIEVICAELAGDFHLGYARQLTDKSSLLFDLAF